MTGSELVRAGFRAAFRRPEVVVAEIVWRWAFGAAAGAIVAVALLRFLASLTVTEGDLFGLRSGLPPLMADAILHIFEGAGARLLRLTLVSAAAIAVLWMLAASAGRAATLRALVADVPASFRARHALGSLLGVNFFRVFVTFLGALAAVGAAILAGHAANLTEDPSILMFNVVFLALLFVACLAWSTLNWYFSLAPIFVVRDHRSAFASVADAVHLVRRRNWDMAVVSTLYGLLKLFAIAVATVLSLLPLGFIAEWPWELTTAVLVVIALAYFAVADVLYIARLASYLLIADQERAREVEEAARPSASPVPAEQSPPVTSGAEAPNS
jgi:hypothetical protein